MRSFFLPNWSPPDDPARPLPAEGRPWPSDDDDDDYVRYALYGSATVLVISVGQGVRNIIVHVINIIIDLNVMRINNDAKYIVLCR